MLTSLIEHIFIIHYTPLIERKNRIVSYFNENNIRNYEFRNLYQRENLTEELKDFPRATEYNIADFFKDEFFETKKVVHLPLKFKA